MSIQQQKLNITNQIKNITKRIDELEREIIELKENLKTIPQREVNKRRNIAKQISLRKTNIYQLGNNKMTLEYTLSTLKDLEEEKEQELPEQEKELEELEELEELDKLDKEQKEIQHNIRSNYNTDEIEHDKNEENEVLLQELDELMADEPDFEYEHIYQEQPEFANYSLLNAPKKDQDETNQIQEQPEVEYEHIYQEQPDIVYYSSLNSQKKEQDKSEKIQEQQEVKNIPGFTESLIKINKTRKIKPQIHSEICSTIYSIRSKINNKYFIPSQFPNLTKIKPIIYTIKKGGKRKTYKKKNKRKTRKYKKSHVY